MNDALDLPVLPTIVIPAPAPVKMIRVVPCEIYSRVVGYFQRVSNWNLGKKAEFADRLEYSATKSLAHVTPQIEFVSAVAEPVLVA